LTKKSFNRFKKTQVYKITLLKKIQKSMVLHVLTLLPSYSLTSWILFGNN